MGNNSSATGRQTTSSRSTTYKRINSVAKHGLDAELIYNTITSNITPNSPSSNQPANNTYRDNSNSGTSYTNTTSGSTSSNIYQHAYENKSSSSNSTYPASGSTNKNIYDTKSVCDDNILNSPFDKKDEFVYVPTANSEYARNRNMDYVLVSSLQKFEKQIVMDNRQLNNDFVTEAPTLVTTEKQLNDFNLKEELNKNKEEKKDLNKYVELPCGKSEMIPCENETTKPQLDEEKILNKENYELKLIASVLSTNDTGPWVVMDMNTPVLYVPIEPGTPTFERVTYRFMDTARNQDFKIERVEHVQNPSIFGQFLLKKDELQSRYGNVDVELLFHGSTEENIKSICENNFNWRTCVNAKFGRGISFSPIATYASHSCERTYYKHMLFCLVLISKECIGTTGMQLPEIYDKENNLRCDTAVKNDRSVVVKFNDHEFYPLYKFCFTGTPKPKNSNRNKKFREVPQTDRRRF